MSSTYEIYNNSDQKSIVNFAEIEETAQNNISGLVMKWLPDGKQNGNEWVAINPTRADNTPGSFKINLQTGVWSDFATQDSGKNVASLYHYLSPNVEYRDSMMALGTELGIGIQQPKPVKKKKPPKVYKLPPILKTYKSLPHSQTWKYQDAQGQDVLLVHRFSSAAKKEFLQVSKVEDGWSWTGLKQNPLYRLLDVSCSELPIVICEGEKAADAAQQIFKSQAVTTTTAGGSAAPAKTDFSPLKNRDVYIWPDNDAPGKKYADKVAKLALTAGAKSVHIFPIPENFGEKWDAADVLETGTTHPSITVLSQWTEVTNTTNTPSDTHCPVPQAPCVQASRTIERHENTEEKPFWHKWHAKTPLNISAAKSKTLEVTENMLPTNIKGWVMDVAKRMQVHPTFSAVAAISFVSSVIARRVNITPMRHNKKWQVFPNTWGAIVGKAGSQKSPSIGPMFEPIRKYDKAKRDLYKIEMENWEYEVEECKKNKVDTSEYPQKPTPEILFTNDATIEALQGLHQDNPQGILMYRDELSGFIDGLSKQGREGARQFFLEGWNGDGTFSYDTVSRGNTYVNGLCLTLFGSIQPSVLAKHVEAASSGKVADGFIQRFQLLVKSSPKPTYTLADADVKPDYQSEQLYNDTFERLLNLPIQNGPITLNFDDKAQALFDPWFENIENRLRSGNMPEILASHISKFRSLMPSLAIIFEAINNDKINADELNSSITVGVTATRLALQWVDYLEKVATDILVTDNEGEVDHSVVLAEKMIGKIKAGTITNGISKRDMGRNFRGKNDKAYLQEAIDMLTENGWLIMESVRTNGRSKDCYFLHPTLVSQKHSTPYGTDSNRSEGGYDHAPRTLEGVDNKEEIPLRHIRPPKTQVNILDVKNGDSKITHPTLTAQESSHGSRTDVTEGEGVNNNTIYNNRLDSNNVDITDGHKGGKNVPEGVFIDGHKGGKNVPEGLGGTAQGKSGGNLSAAEQFDLKEFINKLPMQRRQDVKRNFLARHQKNSEEAWEWLVSLEITNGK